MKRILFFSSLLVALAQPGFVFASLLNAPHDKAHGLTCVNCHNYPLNDDWPGFPPASPTADDTVNNFICLRCHDGVAGDPLEIAAPLQNMHSSLAMGEDAIFPDWTTECVDCHDPHFQAQLDYYQSDGNRLYLVSGVISGIDTTTQPGSTIISYSYTYSQTNGLINSHWLDTNAWSAKTSAGRGLILLPDTTKPNDTYEITAAGDSSITVAGTVDSTLVDKTFGVIYGQLIRRNIDFSGSERIVKFFDPNDEFADAGGNPLPGGLVDQSGGDTPEGICQVCHTRTTNWKNDGTTASHPSSNCSSCHQSSIGFKPSCISCHGYPPGALASYNGTTGSQTAGAHEYHVTTVKMECDQCHAGTSDPGDKHKVNLTVTMGFSLFNGSYQGGEYDGQAGVNYDAAATTPVTVVTTPATGAKECRNIYCHGNYSGSGRNVSPVWDNPASGACSTCHGATNNDPPSSDIQDGAHGRHTSNAADWSWQTWPRNLPCTLCHNGIVSGAGPAGYTIADRTKHVNTLVDWQFDTTDPRVSTNSSYSVSSGTVPPTSGSTPRAYGACSNIYCHSNVQPDGGVGQPSAFDSVTWGDSSGSFEYCVGCHNQSGSYHSDGIDTGSHATHVRDYYFGMTLTSPWSVKKCTICHKWNPAASRTSCSQQCHDNDEKAYHVNGRVDILFDSFAQATANYTGTPQPGDGYGACANTYCHSNGASVATGTISANTTNAWGSGSMSCESCHANPPAYDSGSPKANSHAVHSALGCDDCHYGTTTTGDSITSTQNHVNAVYDLQAGPGICFTYTFAATGSACANISCHGNTDAVWGDPGSSPSSCVKCHSAPQDNGDNVPPDGRRGVAAEFSACNLDPHGHYGAALDNASCQVCHAEIIDGANHRDGYLDILDPDGGAGYRFVQTGDLVSDPDLSNFCANCHDADGATRLVTPLDPFGNGNTPPDVAERFQGTLQWNEWYEDYCFGSEGSNRPVNSHHDISDADQTFSGAKLECLNCHGAHTSTLSHKLADPADSVTAWTGSNNGFCLACHNGGAGPNDPGFPISVNGPSVYNAPPATPVNTPGTACGTGLIWDCTDRCVSQASATSWTGDGYCDDGTWGMDLRCDAFSIDGGDCCIGDCSTIGGIDSCNYMGPPWNIVYKWTNAPHGMSSKRTWNGYVQSPPAPAYEMDCMACHDPHGSYDAVNNPQGNPYMIRDYVDGASFVDDGRRGHLLGQPWTYGTAGPVVVTNPGSGPDLSVLCVKCHSDWQAADATNHECTACLTCHAHGGTYDGMDWPDWMNPPGRSDTPCTAP